jgi:DNA repair photolyase
MPESVVTLPVIREQAVQSILTPVSGFLAEAGFTHSLSPARNCTYGCSYCYVPTMRLYGGLAREDWMRWGQFTTFKSNAPELLRIALKRNQVIYCSPLVDPYQPAETTKRLMPQILKSVLWHPPQVFVIQTRSPLILRDICLLRELSRATVLRVSFSITTDREDVRRRYEPHCESNNERLAAIRELDTAGIEVYATLAPILPCDPETLAVLALEASRRRLIGDPLHTRAAKPRGATTREAAWRIAGRYGELSWFQPEPQLEAIRIIEQAARRANLDFTTGPKGFSWLARHSNAEPQRTSSSGLALAI